MVEAYVEIVSGPVAELSVKLQFGFIPFCPIARRVWDFFLYTGPSTRSQTINICPFDDLLEFLNSDLVASSYNYAEFVGTLIVTPRVRPPVNRLYRIPTINDADCDHQINCGGREIRVHRKLLINASRYFHRIFTTDPRCAVTDLGENPLTSEIGIDALSSVLHFMYGQLVSDHNLQTVTLMNAARILEVNTLFNVCERRMIDQMSVTMAPELLYIGASQKARRLEFEAAKFMLAHFSAVTNAWQWHGCTQLFREYYTPVLANVRKHLRNIVFPEVRSRSENDIRSIGASFMLIDPQFIPTEDIVRESASRRHDQDNVLAVRLDSDFQPIPRKRTSPVSSRRKSDAGVFRMSTLDASLPAPKFSRAELKHRLLASEKQFSETFDPPVESPPMYDTDEPYDPSTGQSSSRSSMRRSISFPLSVPEEVEIASEGFEFSPPSLSLMDVRQEATYATPPSTESSLDSLNPGTVSPQRSYASSVGSIDLPPSISHDSMSSLHSMRSIVPGKWTYSYSSDSVFEKRYTPMSESPVHKSEHTSDFPKSYAHPETATLSDISSISTDSSAASVDPLSSPSGGSKPMSRKEKRLKAIADKLRQLQTMQSPDDLSDLSSGQSSCRIPRPSYYREFPTETEVATKIQKLRDSLSPPLIEHKKESPKKVRFAAVSPTKAAQSLPPLEGDLERVSRNYMSWLDKGRLSDVPETFEETPDSSAAEQSGEAEEHEKSWDEKDDEELLAGLHIKYGKKFKTEFGSTSSSSSSRTSSSSSSPSKQASDIYSRQLPLGGGVIRKTPRKYKPAVDDPMPLSSSESPGTTSSSLSSSGSKGGKKKTSPSKIPLIERGQSFIQLGPQPIRSRDVQQQRNVEQVPIEMPSTSANIGVYFEEEAEPKQLDEGGEDEKSSSSISLFEGIESDDNEEIGESSSSIDDKILDDNSETSSIDDISLRDADESDKQEPESDSDSDHDTRL